MKAEIVVSFEGITELELMFALQGLRNVEQKNPESIRMFILVTAPEMKTEQVTVTKELHCGFRSIRVGNWT